jgi:fibronectin type 3 domain-containing protein
VNFCVKIFSIQLLVILATSCGSGSSTSVDTIPVVGPGSLIWIAPTQREDGSSLPLSEIIGFRVYYGTETGNYGRQIVVEFPNTSLNLPSLNVVQGTTYYMVVTTIDTEGRESPYSDEVVKTL